MSRHIEGEVSGGGCLAVVLIVAMLLAAVAIIAP